MKKFLRWFLFLILFLIFIPKVFAYDYFTEDFTSSDESVWNYFCNYYAKSTCGVGSTNILYSDGSVNLSTLTSNFPVVVSKGDIIPSTGNFLIEIKFRYPTTTNRGVGLGIGYTGPAPYYKLFSQFGIWKDSSSRENFKFYYNDFSLNSSQGFCSNFTNSTSDTLGRQTVSNINLSNSLWHSLEIYKIDDYYHVYIDRSYNLSPVLVTEIKNNCVPKNIWFGNFISDSGGDWTTFSLDSIKIITDIDNIPTLTPTLTPTPVVTDTPTLTPTLAPTPTFVPTSTPTLTPTPTPTPTPISIPTPTPTPTEMVRKKKIFVLPGLGASWNSRAIVYEDEVNDSDWKMTPFVTNYDGLTELLDKNGLVKNQDYYVWNYDWRKPIEEIKNKFDTFIKSKNLNEYDDIYLVGHSLGGVVARLWAQENKDNGNIKQIINLGSPNMGSLDVYSVWNGGEVLENDGISSVAFQILLGLQNKSFLVIDLNKIRNYAPVVKDLLPTFDYVSKDNNVISWNNLNSFNNYLSDKNNNISDISSRFTSVVGVGMSTPEILKLGGRSIYDKLLGLWPDGELLSLSKNNGDGTVLQRSASFGANNKAELTTNHGAIVGDSISVVADKLGLENKTINSVYNDNFKDSLVVFVGSPATGELKCGSEIFTENDGFIVVKNKSFGECNLILSPTSNGLVHLVLGNTENNKWSYIEKEVGVGMTSVLVVNFSDNRIVNDENKNSQYFLRDQIRFDLDSLGLINTVGDFDQDFLTKVALRIFEYRKENDERVITQRILNDLFELSNLIGWDKKWNNFSSLSDYVNLVENKVVDKSESSQIKHNAAVSLALLDDLRNKVLEMSEKNLETSYSMAVVLASGYGTEALRD